MTGSPLANYGKPGPLTTIVSGLPHPEGVTFGSDGQLYCGIANGGLNGTGPVMRVDPHTGEAIAFADTGGRVLGIAADRDGRLYACDAVHGAVMRIDRDGTVTRFVSHAGDRPLLMPNFCVFDQSGYLYVSDSGTAQAGEPTGSVCRVAPDGTSQLVLDGLVFANGLALDEERRLLYIVETREDRVLRAPVHDDGSLGTPAVHTGGLTHGPDGLALDDDGNLLVTVTRGSRLVAVAPNGSQLDVVNDPDEALLHAPSNVAFWPGETAVVVANLFGCHISMLAVGAAGRPLYHQHDR